jgi:ribosomal-protein-alanine acetyltransferase
MAVLQSIKKLFVPPEDHTQTEVIPAPRSVYSIHPLTEVHLKEVLRLNTRCFKNGENYTRHTFSYLLNEPNTLSYRAVTDAGEMAGFIFVMMGDNGAAHLTTIGVAPEHRRRRLAERLLAHIETALTARGASTVMLEVRVGNLGAQELYRKVGYAVVQRIANYYNNGEDCFLMMKSIA